MSLCVNHMSVALALCSKIISIKAYYIDTFSYIYTNISILRCHKFQIHTYGQIKRIHLVPVR